MVNVHPMLTINIARDTALGLAAIRY